MPQPAHFGPLRAIFGQSECADWCDLRREVRGLSARDSSLRTTRASRLSGNLSSSFRAEGFTASACLLNAAGRVSRGWQKSFQAVCPLLAARFRNQPVPEVRQYGPMLLQVDLNCHLASFLVGELDATHRLHSPSPDPRSSALNCFDTGQGSVARQPGPFAFQRPPPFLNFAALLM